MPVRIRKRRGRLPPRRGRHYIKAWREFRGLSQEQVAERLEMSAATLSRIENGKLPYTQDVLELLAEVYLTKPSALLDADPHQKR